MTELTEEVYEQVFGMPVACYICGQEIVGESIPVYADAAGEQQIGVIHSDYDCSA